MTSFAFCTKEIATKFTPLAAPNFISSKSFGVMTSMLIFVFGKFTPLFEFKIPSFSMRASTTFSPGHSILARIKPSHR